MHSNTDSHDGSGPRHKVFVSYHRANDQEYRDRFDALFANIHDIMVLQSAQIGDIDPSLHADTIRQKVRDEYLQDSTVTVVLVGAETWKRKHVDWEIASSIRDTQHSPRSGLFGILLPTYPRPHHIANVYAPYILPPRLYDNMLCDFAELYNWTDDSSLVQDWVHEAFQRKDKLEPNNSFRPFTDNLSGNRWWG
uniref:MTH538 TIR-like domain (DUF1863) n=1 Tax=Candidatus Kentrum sp. FW TaxID=2126338 RepID=A0A450TB89_9GAMM|nr:MAG: MTH538 TIR-like domain (DUF1863) [Candidatus Kentron sp. FW]VFJ70076.1 MAG: MTH538 TIR-like domain (DUF1863) [Candidatus Kentron sp. FW]